MKTSPIIKLADRLFALPDIAVDHFGTGLERLVVSAQGRLDRAINKAIDKAIEKVFDPADAAITAFVHPSSARKALSNNPG